MNRTIAEMDMQAIDERRKNRKQHLPEDMLPHDLQESMSGRASCAMIWSITATVWWIPS